MKMWISVLTLAVLFISARAFAQPPEATTVTITDKVLVKDTIRLGINLCGDNYWDSSICKMRASSNFEGVRYRMMTWGPDQDENGVYVWFAPAETAWGAMKGKVRYTILGGPAKGTTGVIKDIQKKVCQKDAQKRELCYIMFDKAVAADHAGDKHGLMLEFEDFDQGCIGKTDNAAFWNAEQNVAVIGDVPPGSFGKSALCLKASAKPAHYTYIPMWANQGEQNGAWRVRFWAKAKAGTPQLVINTGTSARPDVPLAAEWKKQDLTIDVKDAKADGYVQIRFEATGGDVLLDDIEIWKDEGDKNPTAFRDHFVNVLKGLNPGVVRYLQMGGSDLETNLRPRLQQMGCSRDFGDMILGSRNGAGGYDFNLHDHYVLCEYIGAEPWYCLPGTLRPEEMSLLMEYLAGPVETKGGKLRADLGHPKPWTEVFKTIYVEFGNEAWNPSGYATGSFNGPDHWKDLIDLGKKSQHYKPGIVFIGGSQAGSVGVSKQVARDVPNADRIAVAPYLIHNLTPAQAAVYKSDDDLFRWVFAFTIRRAREPVGYMVQHQEVAKAAKMELAIYEHNYHTTHGQAPVEIRNRYIASIGGAVNLLNDSLMMLKEQNLRAQCLFNLNQKSFSEGVKLWGFMPGLDYKKQRYRPAYLAEQIVNKVIGGDMLATEQAGQNPTFAGTGFFEDSKGKTITYENIPTIWSYAFRNGGDRGVVLVNLDTQKKRSITLQFAGAARDKAATAWWLSADTITANNEPETKDPQVAVREEKLSSFAPGATLELPPCSMVAIKWQE